LVKKIQKTIRIVLEKLSQYPKLIVVILSSFFIIIIFLIFYDGRSILEKCADKGARVRSIELSKNLLIQYEKDYNNFLYKNFETTPGFMYIPVPSKVIIPNNLSNQTKEQYAGEMWKQLKEADSKVANLSKRIREEGNLLDKKYGIQSLKDKLSMDYYYKLFTVCEREYIQSPVAFKNKWK